MQLLAALFATLVLAASVRPPDPELAIAFEDGAGLQPTVEGSRLDAGTLTAKGARKAVWRSSIRVRLYGTTGARFARLSASLTNYDARCRVRLDGVLLSAVPQVVDALAPLGRRVTHTLEIEVPASEPAGPVASSIEWFAETL
jgi:hypothetical protein